ncbi:hypothetical protein NQ317_014480 [Molorchus minor]|uniref:Uncharacterized protein n=1 Tax=Molorchus minor TaxID=1323400 RepID=A0ABQ9J9Z7_9CUCU|nr:hypothetical protein NQ317_014480 [Molorchus minor]
MRKAIENRTRLVPVPPMLRGFMPQKYPITPIRCPLRKLFFGTRAEPTVTEGVTKALKLYYNLRTKGDIHY